MTSLDEYEGGGLAYRVAEVIPSLSATQLHTRVQNQDTIRIRYGNEWVAVSSNAYGSKSRRRGNIIWTLNGEPLQAGSWNDFLNVLRALKQRHPRDTADIVVSYIHTYWSEDEGFELGY